MSVCARSAKQVPVAYLERGPVQGRVHGYLHRIRFQVRCHVCMGHGSSSTLCGTLLFAARGSFDVLARLGVVDIGLVLQQQRNHLVVPMEGGPNQWRPSTTVPGTNRCRVLLEQLCYLDQIAHFAR